MKHFYQDVPGFFTFADFYHYVAYATDEHDDLILGKFPKIVEVGCFAGKSAAFLAVELINSRPDMALRTCIDLVDTFEHHSVQTVRKYLEPAAWMFGTTHKGMSWETAVMYDDGALDMVFIDAGHDYDSVSKDIDAWLPKVRPGGILAGHDYVATNIKDDSIEFPGVVKAVHERFERFEVFRGGLDGGDTRMNGSYFPVWKVQL